MQTFGARRVAAAKKLISGPNLLRFRPKITPTPIISYSKNSYPLNSSTSHTTLDDASEKEIVDVAKTFTLDRILPQAQKFDKSGEYPWILMRHAHQLGLMNTDTPAEYGGLGLPLKTKVKIFEEIGFGCTGLGTSLMVSELAQIPIRIAGTEALREKYLRKMVDEPVLAVGFLEILVSRVSIGTIAAVSVKIKKGHDFAVNRAAIVRLVLERLTESPPRC